MSRSALVLLASLLSFTFTDKLSAQQEVSCVVERITDGDTIACNGERVRLLLIDAPEEGQGPFGRAAQAFLQAILPVGSQATLALDVEHRDQYGRLLAYVYRPEGRMVNAMMVRQGFAVPLVVPPNVRHVEMIRAAADSARENRIGLWAVGAFECARRNFETAFADERRPPQYLLFTLSLRIPPRQLPARAAVRPIPMCASRRPGRISIAGTSCTDDFASSAQIRTSSMAEQVVAAPSLDAGISADSAGESDGWLGDPAVGGGRPGSARLTLPAGLSCKPLAPVALRGKSASLPSPRCMPHRGIAS